MNTEQIENIQAARSTLKLKPLEMAKAMGTPYTTYKDWQSGRRTLTPLGRRCIELLIALKGTQQGKKFGV